MIFREAYFRNTIILFVIDVTINGAVLEVKC